MLLTPSSPQADSEAPVSNEHQLSSAALSPRRARRDQVRQAQELTSPTRRRTPRTYRVHPRPSNASVSEDHTGDNDVFGPLMAPQHRPIQTMATGTGRAHAMPSTGSSGSQQQECWHEIPESRAVAMETETAPIIQQPTPPATARLEGTSNRRSEGQRRRWERVR